MDDCAAMDEVFRRAGNRYRQRAENSARGPLRPREGEKPHSRLSGGQAAAAGNERPNPVLPWTSRRAQNVPRQVDRASARTPVCAHLARPPARLVGIPEPLRDRREIIELAGYTEVEKVHIANRYLIPKQASEHGLKVGEQIEFTDDGLREVIHSYTREAGVRNLEREIATITRKQARRLAEGKTDKMVVTPEAVCETLRVPPFRA